MSTSLSKSLYTKGLQCQKTLWLKKYNKTALTPPNTATIARFKEGDVVGGLACDLFPGGREIPFKGTTFSQKDKIKMKSLLSLILILFSSHSYGEVINFRGISIEISPTVGLILQLIGILIPLLYGLGWVFAMEREDSPTFIRFIIGKIIGLLLVCFRVFLLYQLFIID